MIGLPSIQYDGLHAPIVGPWAEQKYRRVSMYCELFTASMRSRWHCLVYLDLFSGSGMARIRDTSRFLPSSPTIALSTPTPFDRYIFCDALDLNCDTLRIRCARDFPEKDVHVLPGDANERAGDILSLIPPASSSHKVLTFCFVDPFAASNLSFNTIRALATRYMDFLILIPTNYDIKRNRDRFCQEGNLTLDRFLGGSEWRDKWKWVRTFDRDFVRFIVDYFGDMMASLPTRPRYIKPLPEHAALVTTDDNLRLYRLVMYSRHALAAKFWKECEKYASDQPGFDFAGG